MTFDFDHFDDEADYIAAREDEALEDQEITDALYEAAVYEYEHFDIAVELIDFDGETV